nr:uncharacterized protein LOC113399250 [Vanessa tameamea]
MTQTTYIVTGHLLARPTDRRYLRTLDPKYDVNSNSTKCYVSNCSSVAEDTTDVVTRRVRLQLHQKNTSQTPDSSGMLLQIMSQQVWKYYLAAIKISKTRYEYFKHTKESKNVSSTDVPVARRADLSDTQEGKGKKRKKNKKDKHKKYDSYEPPVKEYESSFVEMPKDLYQAHLRPGVIFRIHMSEAILKMQYRNYGEDKDESVIEADVEYLRLTRKVINDEITKFEDLKWLVGWFSNRSELIQEHMCNTRYYAVGIPPTMFTHSEEYMKRMCLFDNVYIDHIPYVVGEDGSLMAAVAPPVLHCDAATCTSVPFIDSIMFDERLSRTNVRTVTRCQASCRAHCRNDPDCLKRCSDRCLRAD